MKKKKIKKTIFIEQNLQNPIGGKSNNIYGHILKPCLQDNSIFRCLGNWPNDFKQTTPPSILIQSQYDKFPQGQITNLQNIQDENLEDLQRLEDLRKAAETHRQVRRFAQQIIRPGVPLHDICNKIEDMNRYLIQQEPLKQSIAFPTGVSVNHIAAHFTPNSDSEKYDLQISDVMKVDFGCQINGRIIDCAFTVAFDSKYDQLLQAVKESTETGLREIGTDIRLADVGAAIYETMTSYEITLDGKILTINPCKNLSGHNILDYIIHGGKKVPSYDNGSQEKVKENELYAVETFGSTGSGEIYHDYDTSHYMRTGKQAQSFKHPKAKQLLNFIDQNYGRLAFCRKWLDQEGFTGHLLALKDLEASGIIKAYPPLCDQKGTFVAQFEHTILIRPHCKEVLSRGPDF